jgi:hypothetical protein
MVKFEPILVEVTLGFGPKRERQREWEREG